MCLKFGFIWNLNIVLEHWQHCLCLNIIWSYWEVIVKTEKSPLNSTDKTFLSSFQNQNPTIARTKS